MVVQQTGGLMGTNKPSQVQRGVDCFMLSNCGYRSENNEDNFYISDDKMVLAVADGMGGEPFGEVASDLAVRSVEHLWQTDSPAKMREEDHYEWVEQAFDLANETILRHSARHTETFGMGTTMVAAVVTENGATIGNVGDSRALLIDGKRASTLTRDHTYEVREYGDNMVRKHSGRQRGGLLRRLGGDYSVTTDLYTISIPYGAWLLLCTDGLHGVISLDEIRDLSYGVADAEEYCEALVEAALDGGGPDNVTVIAWRYREK